ncbi:hypothetical protein ES703_06364 [subsurface metagenome]
METFFLAKDAVLIRTITAFLAEVPDLDEDANVIASFILSGISITGTTDLTVVDFTDVLWANAAEPAGAGDILINVATRQWKAGTALVDGDAILAAVLPLGERVLVS